MKVFLLLGTDLKFVLYWIFIWITKQIIPHNPENPSKPSLIHFYLFSCQKPFELIYKIFTLLINIMNICKYMKVTKRSRKIFAMGDFERAGRTSLLLDFLVKNIHVKKGNLHLFTKYIRIV